MILQEIHREELPTLKLKRVPSHQEVQESAASCAEAGEKLCALMEGLLAAPSVMSPDEKTTPAAVIAEGTCSVQHRYHSHHTIGNQYGYLVAFEPVIHRSSRYAHEPSIQQRILYGLEDKKVARERLHARALPVDDWCSILPGEEMFWPRGDELVRFDSTEEFDLEETIGMLCLPAAAKHPFYAHLQELSCLPSAEAVQLRKFVSEYAGALAVVRAMRSMRNKYLRD